MIHVIDVDTERVTRDGLLKAAPEDHDLHAEFAAWLRDYRETIYILEEDLPAFASVSTSKAS